MSTTGLLADLTRALGKDRVASAPLDRRLFSKDAGVTRGEVVAVTFPETTDEVRTVVRVAASHRVPLVARGAGTGLAGGAVPSEPAVIVVTTRLVGIDVDGDNRQAWVGPGVINLDLSRHVAPLGLHFAPDPSSQAACTIGGNVANNSGGPHCLGDGTTTSHVLAVEFVDADGELRIVGGAAPDPLGLDLRALLVGSEGTLGIVTRVLVALTPNPPDVRTMLFAFSEVSHAAATVSDLIAAGVVPAALEMMDRPLVGAVENFVHAGLPVDAAAVLLAEVTGDTPTVDAEATSIEQAAAANGAFATRVARDEAERDLLWRARKSAFGAIAQIAPNYYLHDTVVPRTRLVEALDEIYAIAQRYRLVVLNSIHAGDGNLHPKFAYDAQIEGQAQRVRRAAEEVVAMSVRLGGVLSGEHGVGLEKRDLMHLVSTPVDLDAQARLRDALDPHRRFNPGAVLPSGSRCFDFGRQVPDGVWA